MKEKSDAHRTTVNRRRLLEFVASDWFCHRATLLVSILCIVISSLVQLAIPFGGKRLMETDAATFSPETILTDVTTLVVLICVFHVVSLAGHLLAYRLTLHVTSNMIHRGLSVVCGGGSNESGPSSWMRFSRWNCVELAQAILTSSKLSGDTLATLITELISSIMATIGILSVVLYISWHMTLLFAIVVGLSQLFSISYRRWFHAASAVDYSKAEGRLSAVVTNAIQRGSAIRVYKCFPYIEKSFTTASSNFISCGERLNFSVHFHQAVSSCITNSMFVSMVGIAAYYKSTGELDMIDIGMFFLYMKQLLDRVLSILHEFQRIAVMIDKAGPLYELCNAPTLQEDHEGTRHDFLSEVDEAKFCAKISNVHFSYFGNPNEATTGTVRNLNLGIERGVFVALVGPSGCGKSTILKLLAGLVAPTSGTISVARDHQSVALLEQSPSIVIGTVRDNICLSRLDASMSEVVSSAKKAGCHDFISQLPRGYETFIENSDQAQFSGGQLQRICLARAFLSDAKLVLLDEPTTGLDHQATEVVLQSAVDLRKEGRTVVFATHDPLVCQAADVVLPMDRICST